MLNGVIKRAIRIIIIIARLIIYEGLYTLELHLKAKYAKITQNDTLLANNILPTYNKRESKD